MIDWSKRGAKILATFVNGYGSGFPVVLPANYLLDPTLIHWDFIFGLPILSGLVVTWPQIAKVINEYANSR